MLKIKIIFYIKLEKNIENTDELSININSISCYCNFKFKLFAKNLKYKIIYKDKKSTILKLEMEAKIDIISKEILSKIKIDYLDMIIIKNNNQLKWNTFKIENLYWYQVLEKQ